MFDFDNLDRVIFSVNTILNSKGGVLENSFKVCSYVQVENTDTSFAPWTDYYQLFQFNDVFQGYFRFFEKVIFPGGLEGRMKECAGLYSINHCWKVISLVCLIIFARKRTGGDSRFYPKKENASVIIEFYLLSHK